MRSFLMHSTIFQLMIHPLSQHFEVSKDVLPSIKTISRIKHLMAIKQESNIALALLDTMPSDVVTVHYNTTTRERLNGEWPSVIIKMSNGKKFKFHSINMAIEYRKKTVNLFLASLSGLALTANCNKEELWKKIRAVTTDSVENNLRIEGLIAASLSSKQIFFMYFVFLIIAKLLIVVIY